MWATVLQQTKRKVVASVKREGWIPQTKHPHTCHPYSRWPKIAASNQLLPNNKQVIEGEGCNRDGHDLKQGLGGGRGNGSAVTTAEKSQQKKLLQTRVLALLDRVSTVCLGIQCKLAKAINSGEAQLPVHVAYCKD